MIQNELRGSGNRSELRNAGVSRYGKYDSRERGLYELQEEGRSPLVLVAVVVVLIIVGAGISLAVRASSNSDSSKPGTSSTADGAGTDSANGANAGSAAADAAGGDSSAAAKESVPSTKPDDSSAIAKRANYIYRTYTIPTVEDRYGDMKAQGYATESFAATASAQQFDSLTCSQMPADSYVVGTVVVDGTMATLDVTADYGSKQSIIKTAWVKDGETWKLNKVTCPEND